MPELLQPGRESAWYDPQWLNDLVDRLRGRDQYTARQVVEAWQGQHPTENLEAPTSRNFEQLRSLLDQGLSSLGVKDSRPLKVAASLLGAPTEPPPAPRNQYSTGEEPITLGMVPLGPVKGAGALSGRGAARAAVVPRGGFPVERPNWMPRAEPKSAGLLSDAIPAGSAPKVAAPAVKGPLDVRPDITIEGLLSGTPSTPGPPPSHLEALRDYVYAHPAFKGNPEEAEAQYQLSKKWMTDAQKREGGRGAVRGNEKTIASCDVTGSCPLSEMGESCPECYVDAPRVIAPFRASKPYDTAGAAYGKQPYYREVLSMPPVLVDFLNDKAGGLRMFSFGDYRPQDKPVLSQIINDARDTPGLLTGPLNVKAITKQPEFVDEFAPRPNVRINQSLDFLPEFAPHIAKGNERLETVLSDPTLNELVSKGWRMDKAMANKERYGGRVNNRYVAMNPEEGIAAVAHPNLDVVTMLHGNMKPDTRLRVWEQTNPFMLKQLGPERSRALAEGMVATKDVRKWMQTVTQEDIDTALGPGKMTRDEWQKLAEKKLCCQTGRCSSSGAKCGFGLLSE